MSIEQNQKSWVQHRFDIDGYVECPNLITVTKDSIDAEKAVLCFWGQGSCEGIKLENYYDEDDLTIGPEDLAPGEVAAKFTRVY